MTIPDVTFDPTNPDPRCACILVLDTSGSMHGEKINQLNQGLIAFRDALQSDSVAQSRVEIAIVTFGPAQLTQDFASAGSFAPPTLSASGDTPLGAALQQSLDMLAMRKKLYKDNGTPYYRPWVFLITDGAPTDGDAWKAAATRIIDEENNKNILRTATMDIFCEYINDFMQNHLQAMAEYYEVENMVIDIKKNFDLNKVVVIVPISNS
jgi:uncharacterized protein YegL